MEYDIYKSLGGNGFGSALFELVQEKYSNQMMQKDLTDNKIPFSKLIMFSIQLVLSVFVATVLIANICGVAVSGALVGAGLSTMIYLVITKFKSPMFVSSSGAFVAPVMAALAIGGYTAVAIGGLVTCLVYTIFGLIFTFSGIS